MNKEDVCHHCNCKKPIGECECKEVQIGCEHCGDPALNQWPKYA